MKGEGCTLRFSRLGSVTQLVSRHLRITSHAVVAFQAFTAPQHLLSVPPLISRRQDRSA
jgi:hypothetical protein